MNERLKTRLFRLICQGCNRYSRAAYSVSGAINLAVQDGWDCAGSGGNLGSQAWCRNCSHSIVDSAGQP